MIEVSIRQYLIDAIDGLQVFLERPKSPPAEYVLLQLVDSGRINHIDAATFFVTVISDNLYSAAQLREQVKDTLFDAITVSGITHSDLGGERANTDSANHVYQYELTFNFYYYREEI